MTAQEVLKRMARTYAECRSYRDTGEVTSVFSAPGMEAQRVHESFSTAFVRPHRFRFEYQYRHSIDGSPSTYVIWEEPERLATWWSLGHSVEQPATLSHAVARASGISSGASIRIPALLAPERVGGWKLTDLLDLQLAGLEAVDGMDCFRLEGRYPLDPPVRLWIDSDSYLLRRVEERQVFDGFVAETVTTYSPATNLEIPDEELLFEPPEWRSATW